MRKQEGLTLSEIMKKVDIGSSAGTLSSSGLFGFFFFLVLFLFFLLFFASAFVSLTFSQTLCINPKFLHLSVLVIQDISPASNVLRMLFKLQLHQPFSSSLKSLIHLFFILSLFPSLSFFIDLFYNPVKVNSPFSPLFLSPPSLLLPPVHYSASSQKGADIPWISIKQISNCGKTKHLPLF